MTKQVHLFSTQDLPWDHPPYLTFNGFPLLFRNYQNPLPRLQVCAAQPPSPTPTPFLTKPYHAWYALDILVSFPFLELSLLPQTAMNELSSVLQGWAFPRLPITDQTALPQGHSPCATDVMGALPGTSPSSC